MENQFACRGRALDVTPAEDRALVLLEQLAPLVMDIWSAFLFIPCCACSNSF